MTKLELIQAIDKHLDKLQTGIYMASRDEASSADFQECMFELGAASQALDTLKNQMIDEIEK